MSAGEKPADLGPDADKPIPYRVSGEKHRGTMTTSIEEYREFAAIYRKGEEPRHVRVGLALCDWAEHLETGRDGYAEQAHAELSAVTIEADGLRAEVERLTQELAVANDEASDADERAGRLTQERDAARREVAEAADYVDYEIGGIMRTLGGSAERGAIREEVVRTVRERDEARAEVARLREENGLQRDRIAGLALDHARLRESLADVMDVGLHPMSPRGDVEAIERARALLTPPKESETPTATEPEPSCSNCNGGLDGALLCVFSCSVCRPCFEFAERVADAQHAEDVPAKRSRSVAFLADPRSNETPDRNEDGTPYQGTPSEAECEDPRA